MAFYILIRVFLTGGDELIVVYPRTTNSPRRLLPLLNSHVPAKVYSPLTK